MSNAESPGPVVVGIDGSDAAIGAAQWAAKEAVHQDVPLRLVHVI
jgi:nucleotide-binding universal stress UspA family protein